MSWVVVGVAAAGVLQGSANEKKMERANKARAATIQYSPWTGMGDPGEQQLPGALEMGLQGASLGASAKGMMGGQGGMKMGEGQVVSDNAVNQQLYNPYMTMNA